MNINQAKGYIAAGNLDLAASSLNQYLGQHPERIEYIFLLATVELERQNWTEAEDWLRRVVQLQSDHVEALRKLGHLLKAQGRHQEAFSAYELLCRVSPQDSEGVSGLGNCYEALGDFDKAIECYALADTIQPQPEEFLSALGDMLKEMGRLEESENWYKLAIQRYPSGISGRFGLADLYHRQGQLDLAIPIYKGIINSHPDVAPVYNNLGNALDNNGQAEEALRYFNQGLEKDPMFADCMINTSNLFHRLGRLQEAEQMLRRALEIQPESFAGNFNLANVLQANQQIDEAAILYEKAIELNPDWPGCYNNLGNIYKITGESAKAIEAFMKTIELQPDESMGYSNLGALYSDIGELEKAREYYDKALSVDPYNQDAFTNLLFMLNYGANYDDKKIYDTHLEWGRRFGGDLKPDPATRGLAKSQIDTEVGERIKVGYVSGDFCQHSVAFFFEPLLQNHNKEKFEIYCYANLMREDGVTARLREYAEHWRSIISLNDEEVAELVRQDGIHILVDLSGQTSGNRLSVFGHAPAPIQVTWLGYPNTTGVSLIDYRIVDDVTDPVGEADNLHVEKLIRLPNGFHCYIPDTSIPSKLEPPSLENDCITFGSFNILSKVTDEVIETWSNILKVVENSRITLKNRSLADKKVKDRVMNEFRKNGIDADRIQLLTHVSNYYDHMAVYNDIDIALDSFPYNGTTTTCEAMWMRVPVVTLAENNHRSRVGKSLLSRVGLNDLVAASTQEYINIASDLANSPKRLSSLRESLRETMHKSPLCDVSGFSGDMENAYQQMLA